MDRLIQLQRQHSIASTSNSLQSEEEEEDSAEKEVFKYIPRRRGDFPPITYLPPDTPPNGTRYDIVDREFDNDVPVYTIRPRSNRSRRGSESEVRSSQLTGDTPTSTSGPPGATRLSSSASSRSTPVIQPTYDPSDPSLIRVDLFEINSYVTTRELERFETWRFENPKPEDYPTIKASSSRASSEANRLKREERLQSREAVKAKPRGRPPKKKRLEPAVVIAGTPRDGSVQSSRKESVVSSVEPVGAPNGLVQTSIEQAANGEDEEMLDVEEEVPTLSDLEEETLRFRGYQLVDTQPRNSRPLRNTTSTRSSSRMSSVSDLERQLQHEASPQMSRQTGFSKIAEVDSTMNTSSLQRNRRTATPGEQTQVMQQMLMQRYLTSNPKKAPDSSSTPLSRRSESRKPVSPLRRPKQNQKESKTVDISKPSTKAKSHPKKEKHSKRRFEILDSQPSSEDRQSKRHSEIHEPPEAEEEPAYEISHIILHDDSRGKRYYLVAWVGYADEDATWLTEDELEDAQEALEEYLRKLAKRSID